MYIIFMTGFQLKTSHNPRQYCFASEPTALEREQARVQWIAEHGEYQPNLTEPAKQQAMAYTNIKQKDLDDERKKTL